MATDAAPAVAPAAAPAALAAAPAADLWIHGSIFFIMSHIFYYEMQNKSFGRTLLSISTPLHDRQDTGDEV